jgi:hypothetical protein
VVAIVNGVPITDADVRLKLKGDMHGAEDTPQHRKNVVESLVRAELVRQKALALGLDRDPGAEQKLRAAEAVWFAAQRTELGEAFFRREIAAKAEVTDADARAYFDANAKRIKTESHVFQILRINDDAGLERDLEAIKKGTPFEDVAKAQFKGLPDGQKPWDLGSMKWAQMPEAWRQTLDALEPGKTSGVIHGPKGRGWIIQLVERHVDESLTFESVKGAVIEAMRGGKVEKLREDVERSLREGAKVEWVKPEGTPAPTGE